MSITRRGFSAITQRWQRPLVAAGSAITLICVAGCTPTSGGAPAASAASARVVSPDHNGQNEPIRMIFMFDASDSEKEEGRRKNGQIALPAIRAGISRGNVQTVILKFDTNVREIGTPVLHKASEFVSLLERNYIHEPGAQGTYFAPVVRRIQQEARLADLAHQRLIAYVGTDGGFNDLSDVARLAGALQQIKCLKLLVIGPLVYERAGKQGSYYDAIKDDLAKFEESRVLVFPNDPLVATQAARELERSVAK